MATKQQQLVALLNRAIDEDGACRLFWDNGVKCSNCPFVNMDTMHCDLLTVV